MPIVEIFVVLIVAGMLLWLVNSVIPLEPTVRKIITALAVVLLVLWLLSVFGLFDSSYRWGRHPL